MFIQFQGPQSGIFMPDNIARDDDDDNSSIASDSSSSNDDEKEEKEDEEKEESGEDDADASDVDEAIREGGESSTVARHTQPKSFKLYELRADEDFHHLHSLADGAHTVRTMRDLPRNVL